MHLTLQDLSHGCCPCGARLGNGQRLCRKCGARSRYRHRQANRKRAAARRKCVRTRRGRR